MSSIVVRALDQKTIERLKERARLNGRTLHQEVKVILERTAGTPTMPEARRLAELWSHRLRGRTFSDSMRLIREDRDSRSLWLSYTPQQRPLRGGSQGILGSCPTTYRCQKQPPSSRSPAVSPVAARCASDSRGTLQDPPDAKSTGGAHHLFRLRLGVALSAGCQGRRMTSLTSSRNASEPGSRCVRSCQIRCC